MRFLSFSFFCFLLLICSGAFAQNSQADLSDKQKRCFSDKCASLGLQNPQFFYQYQININKTSEFKKNGVDLYTMSRRWNGFTPLENVLLVPYVVKGRVVGMEHAPATYGQFKVVYTVAVENTIAGDKLPSKIEVYSRSSSGNNFFFNFNNEPVLQLGEEVVLYLNEMQFTPYQPRQRQPGEPQFEDISIKPAQNPEPKQIFTAALKFTVKNNQLFDAANRPFTTVAEFSKMAGKVYKINQQKKFFKRGYC